MYFYDQPAEIWISYPECFGGRSKDEYSVAYTMAGIAKDVIETRTGVEVTKDELGFLAMYFGVFLLEQAPEQKQYRIAIVCGSGKIIGRLIASQLKNILRWNRLSIIILMEILRRKKKIPTT